MEKTQGRTLRRPKKEDKHLKTTEKQHQRRRESEKQRCDATMEREQAELSRVGDHKVIALGGKNTCWSSQEQGSAW
jgi:hypothetical protein